MRAYVRARSGSRETGYARPVKTCRFVQAPARRVMKYFGHFSREAHTFWRARASLFFCARARKKRRGAFGSARERGAPSPACWALARWRHPSGASRGRLLRESRGGRRGRAGQRGLGSPPPRVFSERATARASRSGRDAAKARVARDARRTRRRFGRVGGRFAVVPVGDARVAR